MRPAEARLAQAWRHTPWQRDNALAQRRQLRERLAQMEAACLQAYDESPKLDNLLNLVWLDLIWEKPDHASDRLLKAPDSFRSRADYHHAQAAAQLQAGDLSGKAVHFLEALESVARALEIEPNHRAALFNRALILERLYLYHDGLDAWSRFIALEREPGWRGEAERHVADLKAWGRRLQERPALLSGGLAASDMPAIQRLAEMDSGFIREYLENTLLIDWARTVSDGRPDTEIVARMKTLIHLLPEPDTSLTAGIFSGLTAPQEAAERPRQASAYLAFRQGVDHLRSFRFDQAEPLLTQAAQDFAETAVGLQVRYHLAELQYYQGRRDEAKRAFADLTRRLPDDHFPELRGRAYWMLGLIARLQEHPVLARGHFQTALAAFVETRETSLQAGAHSLLSETEHFLGAEGAALDHLRNARRANAGSEDTRRGYVIALEGVNLLRARGYPHTAAHLLGEAQRYAGLMDNPEAKGHAFLLGARFHSQDPLRLAGELKAARRLIPDQPPAHWLTLAAQLDLVEGKAVLADDPAAGLALIQAAAETLIAQDKRPQLSELFAARARAHLALQNRDRAEADLLEGIQLVEQRQARISDPAARLLFETQSRDLYDQMIAFQLDSKNPEAARQFAERFRVRGFPVAQIRSDPVPSNLVGKGTVIEYVVLPERLCGWVVTDSDQHFFQVTVEASRLADLVRALNSAVQQDQDFHKPAEALYDLLIQPAAGRLTPNAPLLLVPDKSLHTLPFTLLRNSRSGRYLIEDFPLSVLPASSIYSGARTRYQERASAKDAALVIGNPAFNRRAFPDLRDLPGAEAEAKTIAALYADAQLMTGPAAGPAELLETAGKYGVLHFSGHTITDVTLPAYAHLVMAPTDESGKGVLYGREIEAAHFPETRLVVLAACGAARGPLVDTLGPVNLVRPFLSAGVPVVVAGFWNVDDDKAAAFFTAFHRRIRDGDTPAHALRAVQLAALERGQAVRHWAGYQAYGAGH